MTNSDLDPQDQEMIAAFIDRRMSAEDRQAFMKRLDEEEALYEVFVETVRFRDQEAGRPATVIAHPASRRKWGRLAAVAALIAVAVAAPVVLRNLSEAGYASRLVADGTLSGLLDDQWLDKGWPTMRGSSPGTNEFDTALQAGVRQVELEVALRLGRGDDAEYLAGGLEHLLRGIVMSDHLRLDYAEVREAVAEPETALARAEAVGQALAGFLRDDRIAYDLGQWAEAGVLAARSGNTGLLGSRAFKRELRGFQKERWPTLGAAIAEVAGLLDAPGDQMDLPRLETVFAAIIRQDAPPPPRAPE